jgi:hypothetical protein
MTSRRAEARIDDINSERRRYVSLRVAAHYLDMDVRTLNKLIAAKLIAFSDFGLRRRIEVAELRAFEQRQRREG